MRVPRGDELFGLVTAYWSLGHHRAGTAVDAATVDWLAAQLRSRGLTSERCPVPFGRYDVSSTLSVDGVAVEHLPLYCSWEGNLTTANVACIAFDPRHGGFPAAVDAPVAAAVEKGADAAVLITAHPEGSLVGVNRDPSRPAFPIPVVLAPGSAGNLLLNAEAVLDYRACIVAGETANVVARNRVPGRPIILTTPLTGWFGCAGERGTGIAVLLHLVEQVADLPLLVVATGGHELSFIGAEEYCASFATDITAVIHLGASIGVESVEPDGTRQLAATRAAMTTLSEAAAQPMRESLARARLRLVCDAQHWIGEGEVFRRLGVAQLSISGAGVDFHTPNDTPDRATSPRAMAIAAESIADAARAFVATVESRLR